MLDDGARLAFGDLSGNNRLDSYTNFLDDPQIGLIFFVPGSDHTVRVNGTASLTTDPDICAAATVGDRVPKTAVVVDVDECFLHCGKALLRANIWDTSTWPEGTKFPRRARSSPPSTSCRPNPRTSTGT